MPRVKFLKRGVQWRCRMGNHAACIGTKLKPGIGPVEVVRCGCFCHKMDERIDRGQDAL